tara:strand:- start:1256 stop:4174 length:2919 start_codon:yes stop_codon:yes gene_type:complete
MGMDNLMPQFSWIRPPQQQAFEIKITTAHAAHTIWSSGRIASAAPMHVPSAALPLLSDTAYAWTVTSFIGDVSTTSTAFIGGVSTAAHFTTGLLDQSDWGGAQWLDAGACTEPGTGPPHGNLVDIGTCTGGLLRTDFAIEGKKAVPIGRASLFVSACQYYELYLDGTKVGDHVLDVVWTRFARNRSYASYDIANATALFAHGTQHALGVVVGKGFCGEPSAVANRTGRRAAIVKLVLHSAADDSVVQTIDSSYSTSSGWTAGQSPYRWESTYFGEVYDANLEQPGWAESDFHPAAAFTWASASAAPAQQRKKAFLSSQLQQPIRAVRRDMEAISLRRVLAEPGNAKLATPARWVFDFGEEISGHVVLTLPPGVPPRTNFTLSHAEVLRHPPLHEVKHGVRTATVAKYDGGVYLGNIFWASAVDVYTTAAAAASLTDAEETTYEPRFTYHGFRYVELEVSPPLLPALEAQIDIKTVLGVNVRTDATPAASVVVANPLLQALYENSRRTEASALIGIPNGCAARGERAGWTGDSAFASESEIVDFDSAAFFSNFLNQIDDLQCASDGSLAHCIPETDFRRDGLAEQPDPNTCSGVQHDPSWSTVFPTIAHNIWKYYNATGVVREHWSSLLQYMAMIESHVPTAAEGGLANMFCTWGDWNPVVKTPCHITASASFIHDVRRIVELATALGETSTAETFAAKDKKLTSEFHTAFYSNTTGMYSTGTQCAQALALWLNASPTPAMRASLAQALAEDVTTKGVTIGFIGVRYLFEALVQANQSDAAIACLLRTSAPGYGHEIYNLYEPATSLWESWDGDTKQQWLAESSRSHHYQASISTFLRAHVAGLQIARSSGWHALVVKPLYLRSPTLAALVPAASATVATHRGPASVRWQRHYDRYSGEAVRFELNGTVPIGSTAEIHIPLIFGEKETVVYTQTAGGVLEEMTNAKLQRLPGNGVATTVVGSGDFAFLARRRG